MSLLDVPRRRALQMIGAATAAVAGGGAFTVAAEDDEDDGNRGRGRGEDERDERDDDEDEEEEEEEEKEEEAEVEFDEQTVESAGTPTVYVEEVEVPDGGWIVVHNWGTDGFDEGDNPATNFVGVSAYLEPGEYEHLPIELGGDRAVAGPPSPDDDTEYVLSAMAHRDDPANRTYDFPDDVDGDGNPDDPPYTDDDGNIVQSFADVTFEA